MKSGDVGENGIFGENGRNDFCHYRDRQTVNKNNQMRWQRGPLESGDFGENGVFGKNGGNGD